ncbi:MAG TPA: AMP-binding protein [Actinomycetota bacterium]|nr:AMP-binding protein [Actinomycetota bacterium]
MPHETVVDLVRVRARTHGDKPFVLCGDRRVSFAEADAVSDRVAAGLAEIGVAPGDRVAILTENRPEMVETVFGCAKLGAIQVPLNHFLKGEFLRHQLEDSGASTLVGDRAGVSAAISLLDSIPELKRIVCFDDPPGSSSVEITSYDSVRASRAPTPAVELCSADLMAILYTSGTTGLPKGCMLSHAYHTHYGRVWCEFAGYEENDVLLSALPMYSNAARVTVMLPALTGGFTAVIEPAFHASTFIQRAIDADVTWIGGVGAMGMALIAQPPSPKDRAHKIRAAGFIPFDPEASDAFKQRFGIPEFFTELYGQTECAAVCFSPISGDRRPGSAGKPVPYLDVRLFDDDDREVEAGQVGEIVVRPRQPGVMFDGYWGKPEATLEAFRNLWYHTGDYGRFDAEGFLTFIDRKKDALRRRGMNVSSVELEMAISRHPAVAEAAVVALAAAMTEDDIKACLVLEPDATIEAEALFEFFSKNLPYFAVPRYVEIAASLPKNAMGRVMKHELRDAGVTEGTWDFEAMGLTVSRDDRR